MPLNCKIVFILLFLALAAYGQQERVAIINTVDNNDSLGFNDLSYLTNKLRETAVNILPKSRYGVMTTESLVAFLGSHEALVRECKASSCLAELGRKVSADYVAQAHIGRFGPQLSINFDLYNVASGNLIGSFAGYSKDIFGLLAIIEEKAPALFKEMVSESGGSSAPPPAVVFTAPLQEKEPEVAQEDEYEPYEPPEERRLAKTTTANRKQLNSSVLPNELQLGLRAGINSNNVIGSNGVIGMQLGLVLDIEVSAEGFYIQTGLMYIQKGRSGLKDSGTDHCFELPLLLSLKLSAFRLNAGPYFNINNDNNIDVGLSPGIGFDIGMFYIGAFYDYSLGGPDRTLGLNVGVNL